MQNSGQRHAIQASHQRFRQKRTATRPYIVALIVLTIFYLFDHGAADAATPHQDYPGGPLHVHTSTNAQIVATAPATAPATASATLPQPDLTRLPIGDGKISTTPQIGSIYSCQTRFQDQGGAFRDGAWIKSDGTFDLTIKPTVDGAVVWADNTFQVTLKEATRTITGNDLPNHTTGVYPVARTDDAYDYDRNPNRIRAGALQFILPANPTAAAQPSCLNMGAIGVLLTGTVMYNGLDGPGRDAVAHEIQDTCQGHPERSGQYHYHNITSCIFKQGVAESGLVGYALDGFGIYGPRDETGKVFTNADLDACHGRVGEVMWEGKKVVMYHYRATYEYPYSLGCYMGTPVGAQR